MKFALVNEQRQEAMPTLKGNCPGCGREVISKCGEVKTWHWSHKGRRDCDPWWENETLWHREWKGNFPTEWQEIVHTSETGEKHIADVRTANNWVIEFQHSHLEPQERRSRDSFYQQLVWVVDGNRRKRDKSSFFKTLEGHSLNTYSSFLKKVYLHDCGLLRDWSACKAPVFFDLKDEVSGSEDYLWCLIPTGQSDIWGYVTPIRRDNFIKTLRIVDSSELNFAGLVARMVKEVNYDIALTQASRKAEQARQAARLRPPARRHFRF